MSMAKRLVFQAYVSRTVTQAGRRVMAATAMAAKHRSIRLPTVMDVASHVVRQMRMRPVPIMLVLLPSAMWALVQWELERWVQE